MEHNKDNAKHIEKANFRAAITPAEFAMRYDLDKDRKVQCFYTCADGEGVFMPAMRLWRELSSLRNRGLRPSPLTAFAARC